MYNKPLDQQFSFYPQNFDRTMQIPEPEYNQHIIKTPERNITNGRIPLNLFIDSKDRNVDKFPNSFQYTYFLEHDERDVVSIELVQSCVPYTGYIITKNNNKLHFQESWGINLMVFIPPGNYTPQELGTAIQTAMNQLDLADSTYTVTIDEKLSKYTIASDLVGGDHIFRLIFKQCRCKSVCDDCHECVLCKNEKQSDFLPCSIGMKIGFTKKNVVFATGKVDSTMIVDNMTCVFGDCTLFTLEFAVGENISFENDPDNVYEILEIDSDTKLVVAGQITENIEDSKINANKHMAPNIFDVNDEKYVILEIDDLDRETSVNRSIANSFAIIPFIVPHGENNVLTTGGLPRRGNIKFFNPPLAKLDRMNIRFLTHDNNFYDFNGREHFLEFSVISLNTPGKYNTLITTS